MSLQDYKKESDKQRQEDSLWISTRLGDEGSIKIEQYIGEEKVMGQYGEQLVFTFLALGQEMKLARSFPFSKETDRFIDELLKVKDKTPFVIEKKLDKKGYGLFYARPINPDIE